MAGTLEIGQIDLISADGLSTSVIKTENSGVCSINKGLVFPSGSKIQGDFSNAKASNRVAFQTSTTNGITVVHSLPNGTEIQGAFEANSASDIDNSTFLRMISIGGNYTALISGIRGTGTYLPMTFFTGGTERMRIDIAGNVLVTGSGCLGYSTGSGGTVTQLTSKSTAVTLNKPSGQITMNNAALAAGAEISFLVNNSLITTTDSIYPTIPLTSPNNGSYTVRAIQGSSGFYLNVKNISGGSLSDALVLNFTVIKGATA